MIKLVVHEADGTWSFLCGETHALNPNQPEFEAVSFEYVLSEDPTLSDVTDLRPGWEAERSGLGKPWIRTKIDAAVQ